MQFRIRIATNAIFFLIATSGAYAIEAIEEPAVWIELSSNYPNETSFEVRMETSCVPVVSGTVGLRLSEPLQILEVRRGVFRVPSWTQEGRELTIRVEAETPPQRNASFAAFFVDYAPIAQGDCAYVDLLSGETTLFDADGRSAMLTIPGVWTIGLTECESDGCDPDAGFLMDLYHLSEGETSLSLTVFIQKTGGFCDVPSLPPSQLPREATATIRYDTSILAPRVVSIDPQWNVLAEYELPEPGLLVLRLEMDHTLHSTRVNLCRLEFDVLGPGIAQIHLERVVSPDVTIHSIPKTATVVSCGAAHPTATPMVSPTAIPISTPTPPPTVTNERTDVNEDGLVDVEDLLLLQENWHRRNPGVGGE